MSGTSMATPVTAGSAALVREYFLAGYYPGGTRGSGSSVNPSAALVKAMLVHSAVAVLGTNPAPSNIQGE